MGCFCSYLLPKQDGGTSQIKVNPTMVLDHQSHPVHLPLLHDSSARRCSRTPRRSGGTPAWCTSRRSTSAPSASGRATPPSGCSSTCARTAAGPTTAKERRTSVHQQHLADFGGLFLKPFWQNLLPLTPTNIKFYNYNVQFKYNSLMSSGTETLLWNLRATSTLLEYRTLITVEFSSQTELMGA